MTSLALVLWFALAPISCAWIALRSRWSAREQCEICALVGALIGQAAGIVVNHLL